MDETIRRAIAQSIVTMHENLGGDLTIDDLAKAAMFSKFHFTRVFQRATGLSPGRFLSALRLTEAKRLLITTPNTVADITYQVGYNSVGTFSSRFSASVGVSPTRFRHVQGRLDEMPGSEHPPGEGGTLYGQVRQQPGVDFGQVFIGLFPGRIIEGPPVRHLVLSRPCQYALPDVPAGRWHVIVHSIGTAASHAEGGAGPYTGIGGPISVRPEVTGAVADVQLRPRHRFDPPAILAMPALRRTPEREAIAA